MTELDEIKMQEDAFDYAIVEVNELIKDLNNLYNEIIIGNANLIGAWEGDAANIFREKAAVVEKNISKNIETIQNDLMQGLIETEKDFKDRDLQIARINSDAIITSNKNK